MPDNAIEVRDLTKAFREVAAVGGISFEVRRGEVFSLLGPNGAGKSTAISVISGLLKPDSGDASVMGHSVTKESMAARRCLGVVPQEVALYNDMSARENLVFWGRMYGLSGSNLEHRVDEMLAAVGLVERQKGRVATYSGGMKRRVNIAAALLHTPQVVIMDEPTVGIDPQSRRHILDYVKELNRQGMSVLYTTHYMEEAEELSNRLAIMDKGKIIACGTRDELVRLVGELARVDLAVTGEPDKAAEAWRAVAGVSRVTVEQGRVLVLAGDSNAVVPLLFERAAQLGFRIGSVDIQEPNLETVFLSLTGRALRD
ncbi:MAG TPA: ABC transporter ATP-binding protein [bacterium]|nr:ABC transporter ATP-binding protein [bacterium]